MNNNNTTYHPLGDYIRPVDVRNRDLKVTTLLGLSIEKCFIPSIANTIGTDMSTYKVVMPGQFAYGPVTSRNGDKITIALYTGDEPAIISQAYSVFEIVGECDTVETRRATSLQLLPEYLMMWFRRPEFDRYARYHSHGSAREIFDWAEMCATMVPVPPISEQRAVVADYEAVARRISVAKRTIATLQATAQTLYRKMFVDGIDKENLPEGWRWGTLGDFGEIVTGKTPSTLDETNFGGPIPFVTIPDMHDKYYVFETERTLSIKGADSQKNKMLPPNTICVSCIGTSGLVVITTQRCQTNQQINSILLKEQNSLCYLYLLLSNMGKLIGEYGLGGAVLNNLNKADFENLKAIIPSKTDLQKFHETAMPIFSNIRLQQQEIEKLTEIQSLLLARMGK